MFLKSAILFTLLTTVLSCSCLRRTFEEQFCGSGLVVRARVVARFDNCPGTCDPIDDQGNGKITYIVRVVRTFKGKKPEDGLLFLGTAVNEALCGITLNVGTSYLFNLNASPTRIGLPVKRETCPVASLGVGLCDFPQTWPSLTKQQRRFLSRNAKNGNKDCPAE